MILSAAQADVNTQSANGDAPLFCGQAKQCQTPMRHVPGRTLFQRRGARLRVTPKQVVPLVNFSERRASRTVTPTQFLPAAHPNPGVRNG